MRRLLSGSLLVVVLVAFAVPSFAGTVYVPFMATNEVDGITYETRVSIANSGTDRAEFDALFIAAGADGTQRPQNPQTVLLNGGNTTIIVAEEDFRGLLEISGDADLIIHARLVGVRDDGSETLGVQVPIITGRNIANANNQAYFQGWFRDDEHQVGFGIINLGGFEAECSIQLRKVQGAFLVSNAIFKWSPLTMRHFDDKILSALGNFKDVRAHVSCTQPFYTYATTFDDATGDVVIFGHSALGSSPLEIPGQGPVCSDGAVCFEVPGVFHVPTSGNLVARLETTPPPGTYRAIHARLRVLNGGWSPNRSSGTHNIFWLARDGNRDLFGYVNVKGPTRNEIFIRHGIDLVQEDKPRVTQNMVMNPGETYTFDYTYDTADRSILLVVTDQSGVEVARMGSAPNVNNITISANNKMFWDFGFPGTQPTEPATFGWAYRDLFVEFIP